MIIMETANKSNGAPYHCAWPLRNAAFRQPAVSLLLTEFNRHADRVPSGRLHFNRAILRVVKIVGKRNFERPPPVHRRSTRRQRFFNERAAVPSFYPHDHRGNGIAHVTLNLKGRSKRRIERGRLKPNTFVCGNGGCCGSGYGLGLSFRRRRYRRRLCRLLLTARTRRRIRAGRRRKRRRRAFSVPRNDSNASSKSLMQTSSRAHNCGTHAATARPNRLPARA